MSKYPSNLSPCTAILYGGWQTPIMNKGTPFSFLTVILRYLKNTCPTTEDLKTLIVDKSTEKYLKKISTTSIVPRNNLFLRFELYCIAEFLDFLSTSQQRTVSYKVIPHIQHGDQELAEVFLKVFINGTGYPLQEEMLILYTHFLLNVESQNSINFKDLNMKILPHDWIVEPLNSLHKRVTYLQKTKVEPSKQAEVLNSVRTCTERLLKFLEYCLEKHGSVLIKNETHIAAIYSRIVLTFIMGTRKSLNFNKHFNIYIKLTLFCIAL